MNNLFDHKGIRKLAEGCPGLADDLIVRIYTSRLLGGQPDLVLHGGGNTSVKIKEPDLWGRPREVLYVKGSGIDLAAIDASGFTPLDLEGLRRLNTLDELSPGEMGHQLQVQKLRGSAPDPSVDTLAHAFLPHRFVDHTHADSLLILTNQEEAENLLVEALGGGVLILPYIRPGFPLGRAVAAACAERPEAEAVVVMGHGIFTFADDAETCYGRMIEYVNRAESFIAGRMGEGLISAAAGDAPSGGAMVRLAQAVRGACAHRALDGRLRRFHVEIRGGAELVATTRVPGIKDICNSGVLTPDHVIRTKNRLAFLDRIPEDDQSLKEAVAEQVKVFTDWYKDYFLEQSSGLENRPQRLDPYPRVFVAAGLGLLALGATRREARVAADIAENTLRAKLRAGYLGTYRPVAAEHVFELEYWDLQQKKLGRSEPPPLVGQTALITGGGGAIGLGIADRLLQAGAVVALADLDQDRLKLAASILGDKHGSDLVETLAFDVTSFKETAEAVDEVSRRCGGLDLVVPNAGVAHVATIENLDPDRLDQVLAVNLKGVFNIIKAAIPVFRRQGSGGNIVIISSKNVFDPGASFSAYSASKAGAHQLGKIAALELAGIGVKVNLINPDAVFSCGEVSSKLWDLVGPDRMRSRGLDPSCMQDYYCQRNLLKTQVSAEHVGNAVVFFASDLTPTTGATLPVDGGVSGAFPR
jgi:rhamnose utilization protein RhaD (predicted bifunctional aldolase and dehydrogenase)/NAD(P)-dependent dehydrogenase (short-subunit alcohol dehydrogenase family)